MRLTQLLEQIHNLMRQALKKMRTRHMRSLNAGWSSAVLNADGGRLRSIMQTARVRSLMPARWQRYKTCGIIFDSHSAYSALKKTLRGGEFFEGFGLIMIIQCSKDLIHITIHDAIQLVQSKIDPMISKTILRKIICADFFAAISADPTIFFRADAIEFACSSCAN